MRVGDAKLVCKFHRPYCHGTNVMNLYISFILVTHCFSRVPSFFYILCTQLFIDLSFKYTVAIILLLSKIIQSHIINHRVNS